MLLKIAAALEQPFQGDILKSLTNTEEKLKKKKINIFLVAFNTALCMTHVGIKSANYRVGETMPMELYKNK